MQVYEAVAATLVNHGVGDVFGLMGDGNLKLIPHLTSTYRVRMFSSRHESAAIAMADGYARTSGRIGVCTVTQGPGVTNALTPLISARKAGTPLLLLAGDTPHGVPGLPQDCDQAALFAAAGVPMLPFRAESAATDVAAAISLALATPGPIALSMPTDVQDQMAGTDPTSPDPAARVLADAPLVPDVTAIAAAADLLSRAERPIVLAGRGAIRADAHDAAVALADQVGALLATSLPAKSFFSTHEWAIGVCGGLATPLAVELIAAADVVVVLGASVNSFTSKAGTLLSGNTKIIHVDASAAAIGAYNPTAVGIVGDATVAAEQLRTALMARAPVAGYRTEQVRRRLDTFDWASAHVDAADETGLDPRSVCARLEQLLPVERSVITDGGHFCGFPAAYLSVPDPSAFVFALDFGAVGLGLGTALGAAVAHPERLTVLGIGDGGLMMSLAELETAVRYEIQLLILVFDDRAYGAEMHFLRMLGLPEDESLFPEVDFQAVSESLGMSAVRIDRLDQLPAMVETCRDLAGPLFVHIPVTQNVRAGWLEEAFARTVGH